MLLVRFFIQFFLFLVTVVFALYLPGFLLLSLIKLKIDDLEKISLSLSLGIVFLVFLSIIFGILGIRFLLLPVILFLSFWCLLKAGREPFLVFQPANWSIKNRNFFFFLLCLGLLAQLWINVFSGWHYADGIRFWSAHGHDGIWHGSLMQELRNNFPPRMRFIGNLPLKNYHFYVDVLFGEFHRLFGFDPFNLYFRHFTFLFAVLFLINTFVLVYNWQGEKAGLWAMFFLIFGGSFGYLVTIFRSHTLLRLRSEAVFWVSQGNTAIGNPPQIIGMILFLAYLDLFYHWLKKRNSFLFIVLSIFGGLLWGFKVYTGATVLAGLGLIGFFSFVFRKKTKILRLFLMTLIPSLLVFFSTTKEGQSFLVFQPFWFVRTMIVAGDRLGWMDLEMRRQFYVAQNNWRGWLRVLQFEGLALLIFIVGNLGTKVLGFGEIFKILLSCYKAKIFDLFLIFCLLVCFVFPHLFVQKGVAWNTVQFFHYFVMLMAIFSGAAAAKFLDSKQGLKKLLVLVLLVIFSVPTVWADLIFFAPGNALAVVENQELEALKVLQEKTEPGEVIVTFPFHPWAWEKHRQQPRLMFTWDGTGYVSYFSNRPTFIADQGQVEIMGYSEGKKRVKDLKEIFFDYEKRGLERDPQKARQYLLENNLKYVYLVYNQQFAFDPDEAGLEKIFENPVARIYQLKL